MEDEHRVLRAVSELPFPVGRALLVSHLTGAEHPSITRHKLHELDSHACLAYGIQEAGALISTLIMRGQLSYEPLAHNKHVRVITLTVAGMRELESPSRPKPLVQTPLSEQERILIQNVPLPDTTQEQKRAILTPASIVLCIAGAGSGKTHVLTERIRHLVTHRSVDSEKILAITFTRKARVQMRERLFGIDAHIETFNSLSEKYLQRNEERIYAHPMRVLTQKDMRIIFRSACEHLSLTPQAILDTYYTENQRKNKTSEQLLATFIYDIFIYTDHIKTVKTDPSAYPALTELLTALPNYIIAYMRKHGIRSYADQLIDTLRAMREHPQTRPRYEHILIDELQDVNDQQIELIDMLAAPNLFCVGDPRQSIYGWRGSNPDFLLTFPERYRATIIHLTTNFRSNQTIVKTMNAAIRTAGLPPLTANATHTGTVTLLSFDTEKDEYAFIATKILANTVAREEIFVLARTNRQLNELSDVLVAHSIPHIMRTEDSVAQITRGAVTLSTVHAIKGLEAHTVYVIGCNTISFPCKTTDHPISEIMTSHDTYAEEQRLFYVAVSRAKESLTLTYTGTPTEFITEEMRTIAHTHTFRAKRTVHSLEERLRIWRRDLSAQLNMPPYKVLNDRTLIELARNQPQDPQELLEIVGMGPAKVHRYGKDILRILNA